MVEARLEHRCPARSKPILLPKLTFSTIEALSAFLVALRGHLPLQLQIALEYRSPHDDAILTPLLIQHAPSILALEFRSLQHVRSDSLACLVQESALLERLVLQADEEHLDWTELAWVVRQHLRLSQVVVVAGEQATLNPTLDALGEALLQVKRLRQVQFGRDENSSLACFPFSPELLSALVQDPVLQELRLCGCRLDDAHWNALARGLAEESLLPEVGNDDNHMDLSEQGFLAMKVDDGLEKLSLKGSTLSDHNFERLIQSLAGHSSLRFLNLEQTLEGRGGSLQSIEEWNRLRQRKEDRTRAVLHMLQSNLVLEEIQFTLSERDEGIVNDIEYYLKLNRMGLRRMKSGVSRAVWGQSVISLRNDPSSMYCLFQQRPDLICSDAVLLAMKRLPLANEAAPRKAPLPRPNKSSGGLFGCCNSQSTVNAIVL